MLKYDNIILYNYIATVCDVSAGVSFFFFLERSLGNTAQSLCSVA